MKKVFALISVFALAMGAMAETQSATLTLTESTIVTDNKVSQNGIVLSNVADFDGEWLESVLDGELTVSLDGGYDITKIVITPQPGYEGDDGNADWIVGESSVTWTKDGDNAVWEGNAKSVPFGEISSNYAVKDIIVYYDDATPSKTLTVDLSLPVADGKISQNGVVVSNVAEIQNSMGEVWLLSAEGGELTVSLAGGYDITKIVITPQSGWELDCPDFIVDRSSVTWTKDGDNAVWEGNAKSVPFGTVSDYLPVLDIIVYYDDATATAAVEAQADKQKAVKSINRFGEVTIEADGVKFGINGVKK